MAFTLVADIFAKVDGAITSMVSANVATIISDVTPLIATCLTIKLMVQGMYSAFNPGAGDSLSSLIKEYLSKALILSYAPAGGWSWSDWTRWSVSPAPSTATTGSSALTTLGSGRWRSA